MNVKSPAHPLPRAAAGIDSAAVTAFLNGIGEKNLELHSYMLLQKGQVVAEGWWDPYRPEYRHMLFSLSKSFTSTGAGLAISEGRFSLDDPVLKFFPEEAPPDPGPNLRAMKVRHLLSMSTGHEQDTLGRLVREGCEDWASAFLSQPVEREPGTHFVYNSGATYMVSAIVQRVTGQTLLSYLEPRLLTPLGIIGATWESCPRGVNTGGWGLSIRTEDIARFGQLYLLEGEFEGQRLVPTEWVREATRSHISNGDNPESDWNQGYGFQFWRSRRNAYRGDGAFGQFCVVMPDEQAVFVSTAGTGDMQAILNELWTHLLPALNGASGKSHDGGHLQRPVLKVTTPAGGVSSPRAREVSGRRYRFEENDQKLKSLTFEFGDSASRIRIEDGTGDHRLEIGLGGEWKTTLSTFGRGGNSLSNGQFAEKGSVAASGAWSDEKTFICRLALCETPFTPTLTCEFEGAELRYAYRSNVSFGPNERPVLTGRREGS